MSDTSQPLTTPFYLHLMQYLAIDIALAMYIFACVCSIKLFRVFSIPELQYSRLNGFSVSRQETCLAGFLSAAMLICHLLEREREWEEMFLQTSTSREFLCTTFNVVSHRYGS